MKEYGQLIATTVVTFFVTAVSTAMLGQVGSERGEYSVGAPLRLAEHLVVPVLIVNYEPSAIDGLFLSVPPGVQGGSISSSVPIEIQAAPDASSAVASRLKVSGVPALATTELLVPVESVEAASRVALLNPTDLNLAFRSPWTAERTSSRRLKTALVTGAINAVVYFAFLLYVRSKAQKEIADVRRSLADADKKAERQLAVVARLRTSTMRIKILYLRLLSDYRRELAFWRDTIRRTMYEATGGKVTADTIISNVTEALATHGTKANAEDFDTIQTMAALIANRPEDEVPLAAVTDDVVK